MSAEFYLELGDPGWLASHEQQLEHFVESLSTFKGRDRWGHMVLGEHDARIILSSRPLVCVEIYLRPRNVENDLRSLFAFIRTGVGLKVVDDDGVDVGW